MWTKLSKLPGLTIGIIILALGVVAVIIYQVVKANNDVTDAAKSVGSGGLGDAIANNIGKFEVTGWSYVKKLFGFGGSPDTTGDGTTATSTGG